MGNDPFNTPLTADINVFGQNGHGPENIRALARIIENRADADNIRAVSLEIPPERQVGNNKYALQEADGSIKTSSFSNDYKVAFAELNEVAARKGVKIVLHDKAYDTTSSANDRLGQQAFSQNDVRQARENGDAASMRYLKDQLGDNFSGKIIVDSGNAHMAELNMEQHLKENFPGKTISGTLITNKDTNPALANRESNVRYSAQDEVALGKKVITSATGEHEEGKFEKGIYYTKADLERFPTQAKQVRADAAQPEPSLPPVNKPQKESPYKGFHPNNGGFEPIKAGPIRHTYGSNEVHDDTHQRIADAAKGLKEKIQGDLQYKPDKETAQLAPPAPQLAQQTAPSKGPVV